MSGSGLAGFSTVVEIDASREGSPWNELVRNAFLATLPRMMGGDVPLGTLAAGPGRTAHLVGLDTTAVSTLPGADSGTLELRLTTTIQIDVTDAAGAPAAAVTLSAVTYARRYRPTVEAVPARGVRGTRRLVAQWDGASGATDAPLSAWEADGRLRDAGVDPAAARGTALAAVNAFFASPLQLAAIATLPAGSPPPTFLFPPVLSTINTFNVEARLLSTAPAAVALLIEGNTRLRAAALPARAVPDPTAYAARQLMDGETVAMAVEPIILLESMAHAVNLLLNIGTGMFAPPGSRPAASLQFINPRQPPPEARFVSPFGLIPGLPPLMTDLTVTAPGVAPRVARAQRLGAAIVGGSLRLTVGLSDPNDWAGIVWGFQGFIDWAPSTSGGTFFWTATPPVVESSYAYVSPFWWILEGVLLAATVVTGGIAGTAAAGVAVVAAVLSVILGVLTIGLGDVLIVLQGSVSRILSRALGSVGGITGAVPPIGISVVPPEIMGFLGRFTVTRGVLDDLVIGGRLAGPDVAVHVQARDLTAATGQAFDLDNGLVIGEVSESHIPRGADVLWWRSGGTLVMEIAPPCGFAALATDSLLSVRFEDIAVLPFAPAVRIGAASLPQFDSAPPFDTRGLPLLPLFFAIRTSEGRFAKCAAWRDRSDGLHLHVVTYATALPHFALAQSRRATRGAEIERGWSAMVLASYVRYEAAWEFAFHAAWQRLREPVSITWSVEGRAIATRLRLRLASGSTLAAELRGDTLSVATEMGEPAEFEVRAVARDALGLELEATARVETDGSVTEWSESQLEWLRRESRAVVVLDQPAFRVPLDMGDPAPDIRSYDISLSDAVTAGMGFSVQQARAAIGLDAGIPPPG